jgi:hypothetical protein
MIIPGWIIRQASSMCTFRGKYGNTSYSQGRVTFTDVTKLSCTTAMYCANSIAHGREVSYAISSMHGSLYQ